MRQDIKQANDLGWYSVDEEVLMKWTVARFPDGSWTTGGKPNDPDYANCEVFEVDANDRFVRGQNDECKRPAAHG